MPSRRGSAWSRASRSSVSTYSPCLESTGSIRTVYREDRKCPLRREQARRDHAVQPTFSIAPPNSFPAHRARHCQERVLSWRTSKKRRCSTVNFLPIYIRLLPSTPTTTTSKASSSTENKLDERTPSRRLSSLLLQTSSRYTDRRTVESKFYAGEQTIRWPVHACYKSPSHSPSQLTKYINIWKTLARLLQKPFPSSITTYQMHQHLGRPMHAYYKSPSHSASQPTKCIEIWEGLCTPTIKALPTQHQNLPNTSTSGKTRTQQKAFPFA